MKKGSQGKNFYCGVNVIEVLAPAATFMVDFQLIVRTNVLLCPLDLLSRMTPHTLQGSNANPKRFFFLGKLIKFSFGIGLANKMLFLLFYDRQETWGNLTLEKLLVGRDFSSMLWPRKPRFYFIHNGF